jgi:hypothetical protein
MVKFKNFMFNVFGISFHIGVVYLLYLAIHGILTDSKDNFRIDWPLGIMSVFLIFLVLVGGRYFFKFIDREIYAQNKFITIFGYIYYFRELKDRKWIYHSDLGYYLCIITKDEIRLFEPNFIYMNEIYNGYNHGGVEKISVDIKSSLDNRYKKILRKIQEDKEDRERINKIKSWDGYLDTQSRRDNKIDKILK